MASKLAVTHFGPFTFDPRRQELTKRGHRIRMPASQLRLLNLFLDRPGDLITRDEITAALWVNTSNIDVPTGINTAIKRLRQSLSDFKDAPEYIETVIGIGYRFVAELQEAPSEPTADLQTSLASPTPAPTAAAIEAGEAGFVALDVLEPAPLDSSTLHASAPSSATGRTRSYRRVAAIGLGCLIVVGVAGSVFLHRLLKKHTTSSISDVQPEETANPTLTTWEGQLDKITTAAMSPDGRGVAYSNRDGVSVHWFDRGEELLTSFPPIQTDHISWFPDGKQLLLTGTNDQTQRREVWSVQIPGWLPTRILRDADHAVVSPDGTSIAYTREHGSQIWIANVAGQNPRRIIADSSDRFVFILWAPSGDHLLVGHETAAEPSSSSTLLKTHASYEAIDATSGAILDRETKVPFTSGYALPDGRLYFPVEAVTKPFEKDTQLMRVPIDPGSGRFLGMPQVVQHLKGSGTSLSASLDGRKSAFILDRPVIGLMVGDLRRPGPSLENVRAVPSSAMENFPHAWTADGSAVLLERELSHGYALYQQPVNGLGPTLVSRLADSVAMAQVTPDGRWILFQRFSAHPQKANGIFRTPAAGGNAQQLPGTEKLGEFHCSLARGGRCVMREEMGSSTIAYFELDPIKGLGRVLARTPWQPGILGDWDISPDGKTVAIADHDQARPQVQLVPMDSSSTEVTNIPIPGHGTLYEANWAADGNSLFVEARANDGFELLHVDLAGHIVSLRKSTVSLWAVPSRDGTKLAFPGLSSSRNVWIMDTPQ